MAAPIGANHGAESLRQKLHRMDDPATSGDFSIDNVLGAPGAKYDNNAPNTPVEGTLTKLVVGHNEVWGSGGLAKQVADLREEIRLRPFA